MDTFRASTQLWSAGGVDANSNFRPIQANPSCVRTCAGDDSLSWCPSAESIEYPLFHYEVFAFLYYP